MNVWVLNCGSSSLKSAVIDTASGKHLIEVRVEKIGEPQSDLFWNDEASIEVQCPDHRAAIGQVAERLNAIGSPIAAIGHRVVHGGETFTHPVIIDDQVDQSIEAISHFAPLHNPANLVGIRAARQSFPELQQVAVFDTAFHASIPTHASTYALPKELCQKHGIRRYGFHGTSHAFVTGLARSKLDSGSRLISCHLGNGASVAAVLDGRSVDTSMGMTPLEGLVMGTRSGDLDPGILLALLRDGEFSAKQLDDLLNRKSGLRGISGQSNDLREILSLAAAGDADCRLAFEVFSYRIRKYIGAYLAVLGGLDALIFTGGIGENSAVVREQVCQNLEGLGIQIDQQRNDNARPGGDERVIDIATVGSGARILVIATDEEWEIAKETVEVLGRDE